MLRGDIVHYARIQPSLDVYEVLELKVRTVETDWFTGVDKRNRRVYLFSNNDLNKIVFSNRKDAISIIEKAKKGKKKLTFTIDTE